MVATTRTGDASPTPLAARALGVFARAALILGVLVAANACGSEDVLQPGPYDASGLDPDSKGTIDVQSDVFDAGQAPDCPAGYRVWPEDALGKAQCVPDTSLQCSSCETLALTSASCTASTSTGPRPLPSWVGR